ncbi:NAD(+) diphosphatase [Telmatospirillum sp. J64-1]|uniref:NAD(+) diphosphatase n=1 Tax=Telmatospirillum sp. J64-1 TaxID=2502183 RepID=UPI00115D5BF7|nr:NAD(+) diphosphatase [Telmatospirillum sp. J64-1]
MSSIIFASNSLDRASHLRPQADRLIHDPQARILPFWQLKIPLRDGILQWLPPSEVAEQGLAVFLGMAEGRPHFAVEIPGETPPSWGEWTEVRMASSQVRADEAGILAQARALLAWHQRHRFCANCGVATDPSEGGTTRLCSACGTRHFPRTDPAVIMLVTEGDRCLLGRSASFPPGQFSALAGFMEPGETIEAAVRREVWEEAGVTVGEVKYFASQPWPFPASLMIGCFAQALDATISLNDAELEQAIWVDRAQAAEMLARAGSEESPRLPNATALAYHMVRAWLEP